MSKIGKKPVKIPQGVDVKIEADKVIVKGPKGQLEQFIVPMVKVVKENNEVKVLKLDEKNRKSKAFQGLMQRLITNMVIGVTQGFSKQLEINGVGYKAQVQGKNLVLSVGFSHDVVFPIPEGIDIKVEKNIITVSGIDKQKVGQVAVDIRRIKPPDPYKHKGIKYVGEYLIKKVGKKGV